MKINKNIPHCHDITEILFKVALNTMTLIHTVEQFQNPMQKSKEAKSIPL